MTFLKAYQKLTITGAAVACLLPGCVTSESLSDETRVAIPQVSSTDVDSFDTSTTSTSLAATTSTLVENAETEPNASTTTTTVDSTGTDLSVSVSKAVLSPGDTFTISIEASDVDGVERVGFWLEVNGAQRDFCSQFMEMKTGTITSSTWSTECAVPAVVIGGSYTVYGYASDLLHNLTESAEGATFIVEGGTADNDGPSISSISLSKTTVASGDAFTVSIDAQDPSGVAQVGFFFVLDGVGRNDFCGQSTNQSSGSSANGVWSYECTVPESTPIGSYTVLAYAKDEVLNWTNNNCCTKSGTFARFTVTS